MTLPCRHLSISIERSPEDVYDFVSQPENLPLWAKGLCWSAIQENDVWTCDSPLGKIRINFTPRNNFGILDHVVTLSNGFTIYNPMRVLPNALGAEIIFTIFRPRELPFGSFMDDVRSVEKDLLKLKSLLEGKREEILKAA